MLETTPIKGTHVYMNTGYRDILLKFLQHIFSKNTTFEYILERIIKWESILAIIGVINNYKQKKDLRSAFWLPEGNVVWNFPYIQRIVIVHALASLYVYEHILCDAIEQAKPQHIYCSRFNQRTHLRLNMACLFADIIRNNRQIKLWIPSKLCDFLRKHKDLAT